MTFGPAPRLSLTRKTVFVCSVVPGLTIYLPEPPTRSDAESALKVYQHWCPAERRRFVSGSRAPAFARIADPLGREILESHLKRMEERKDQGIMLWDGLDDDSWSIAVQGVPPSDGTPRASFLHLLFPRDVEPSIVLALAVELTSAIPILSGHGGWTAVFNAEFKATAFDQIYAWAKRYPGIEVEDLNLTVNQVVGAIKGANWITLVGDDLWGALESRSGGEPTFPPEIEVKQVPHGRILRAGPVPSMGDRNRAETPPFYVAAERALEPIKLTKHEEFAGRFTAEGSTMRWLRRFLEPENW